MFKFKNFLLWLIVFFIVGCLQKGSITKTFKNKDNASPIDGKKDQGPNTSTPEVPTFSYAATSAVVDLGSAIVLPVVERNDSGGLWTFSIEPALPQGLAIDTSSGAISGIPTATLERATYTITAKNAANIQSSIVLDFGIAYRRAAFAMSEPTASISTSRIKATWSGVTGAASYEVSVRMTNDCYTVPLALYSVGSDTLTKTTAPMTDGAYYVCVASIDGAGVKSYSTDSPLAVNVTRWFVPYSASAVFQASDGKVYLAGNDAVASSRAFDPANASQLTTISGASAWVARFDANFKFEAVFLLPGGLSVSKVFADTNQDIVLSGSASSHYVVTKLNAIGQVQWSVDGPVGQYDSAIGPGGATYILGGFSGTVDFNPTSGTDSLISNGYTDTFVTKINSDGSYGSSVRFGTGLSDGGWGGKIAVDQSNGNVYLADAFKGSTIVGPGTASHTITNGGYVDNVVIALDGNLGYRWIYGFEGNGWDYAHGLSITQNHDVMVYGYCGSTVLRFTPTDAGTNCNAGSMIAKLRADGSFAWGRATAALVTYWHAATPDGHFYSLGTYTGGPVNFDVTGGTDNSTAVGGNDAYLGVLGSDGTYGGTSFFGTVGAESIVNLYAGPSGQVFVIAGTDATSYLPFGDPNKRAAPGFVTVIEK